jgi:hypothetical protein
MRMLVIAAATAVGFALPAAAANVSNTSPGSNSPGDNTPSYNQQANGQQNNAANSGQQNWANGALSGQSNAGQGWQNHNLSDQNAANIRQRISQNLSQAGFTDIHIMPRAFLVHAKDRDGNPVTMMITPNSVMALTAVPAGAGQSMAQQGGSAGAQTGVGNNSNGSMAGNGNGTTTNSGGTTSQ